MILPVVGPDLDLDWAVCIRSAGLPLGRGGGWYDRVLARVPVGTFTCVLLYDDEVGREVPSEPHDRRVAAAVSPTGIVRFRAA
ncbi:MAG: hypothetical protein H0X12_07550 [Nocardioides sp.]|nr:hypothetical protein [Nocardioides sp.]